MLLSLFWIDEDPFRLLFIFVFYFILFVSHGFLETNPSIKLKEIANKTFKPIKISLKTAMMKEEEKTSANQSKSSTTLHQQLEQLTTPTSAQIRYSFTTLQKQCK